MRVRQDWLVLALIVGALLGLAGVIATRMGNSHHKAMVVVLKQGLERAYDEAVSRDSSTSQETQRVSSRTLADILLNPNVPSRSIVPGLVKSSNVFLPDQGAAIPSMDLLCVVRMDSGHFYAIDGRRGWRELTEEEFRAWPHQALSAGNHNTAGGADKARAE